jgi:hypothetical protein
MFIRLYRSFIISKKKIGHIEITIIIPVMKKFPPKQITVSPSSVSRGLNNPDGNTRRSTHRASADVPRNDKHIRRRHGMATRIGFSSSESES